MSIPVPPLQLKDLPERTKSFWRMAGPGAIMVGLAIGAGELVVWPWVTAKFGAVMLWAAALGVFMQLWINVEIGRWAIVTGENPYTGFARVSIGFIYFFLSLSFVGLMLPGWARLSGVALKGLLFGPDGPGADWVWTIVTFIGIAVLLFGPKVFYNAIEKSVGIMVLIITVGMLLVAANTATWEAIKEMGRGAINFGHIELDDEFTFARFFGAVVFAGVGGVGNLYYAFYLRDKGIGMGARIPKLLNPLRQQEPNKGHEIGFIYEEQPENQKRFRSWLRYVIYDQTLFFWIGNTFMMFLFMLGALTVLRPLGIVPQEGQIVWDEAQMLATTMGEGGRYLFLIVGMAALFSSQLLGVDGGARTWSYIVTTNFKFGRKKTQSEWYVRFAIAIMAMGSAATIVLEILDISALGFIFNAALLGGFAMAVYVPLVLFINLRYLPASARPKPLNIVMVSASALVYISFAVYTLKTALF
jgi:Mn2+/Fe2+ NRAMP family transporter